MQAVADAPPARQPDPPPAAEPEVCARCHADDLDTDGFCSVCGAVTLADDRFVVSYGPDR